MALSIKTREADQLARELAHLTGETMTGAVTTALRERLERERQAREAQGDLPSRLKAHAARLRARYDIHSMSKADWDAAWGEEA